ncbi:SDR family NAD(P)-dependent oxidoreductase, partial [bacterium]|nr:SDR family NAD(P)-dependent oxidoreductase [bacterium]
MLFSMKNKIVLITGGSTGIGRASAIAFSREGSKVIIADLNVDEGNNTVNMIEKTGGEAVFVEADVSKAKAVESLIDNIVNQYGRLDCAVNNAGVVGEQALTADCTEDNWDNVIGVNLKGTWLCMKYEIRQMLKQGNGSIVNISSVTGSVGYPSLPAYVT